MDARDKLARLAADAQYDLSCACGTKDQDRRVRGADGMWVYPAAVPSGGKALILKSLLTNACGNDCRYCPLRRGRDTPRTTLQPDDMARLFIDYQRRRNLHGLFLTSGVPRDADHAMRQIVDTAAILRRKYAYRGFLHLKIIPGASDGAIEAALALASTVSLNVEAPTRSTFERLTRAKRFERDVVEPIRKISQWTARGGRYARVKQTTQFVVGAAGERDREIVTATHRLYRKLRLNRVYFSAYQRARDAEDAHRPAPSADAGDYVPQDLLTREHRLYQVDFLLRKYKWELEDVAFEDDGNLSLAADPKLAWARRHPEAFPVPLRTASKQQLLRVPGLGPITVGRILQARRSGGLRGLRDVGVTGKRLAKADPYVVAR
ncbi:MAG: radical SAM protein [Phycisphaerae bacterium]|nr:radical SAM protein [Phycisphaerae bacterium]